MNKLLIICGIPFAGKTTLAAAIVRRFGYVEIDVDDMKDRLYGRGMADSDLGHSDWVRIYEETNLWMLRLLESGQNVVDASRNFRKYERQLARSLATTVGADAVTSLVDTPEAVARQRLLENRTTRLRHDVSDENFADILYAWEPPGAGENPLIIRYGHDLDSWIAAHVPIFRE